MDRGLTTFQQRCLRALEQHLGARDLTPSFESMEPDRPAVSGGRYLKASVTLSDSTLDLYIYEDEAGFSYRGAWQICERQDYPSDAALIEALIGELEAAT